jgi:WhiB family redox-sensing transcriptional regulator
MQIFSSDFPDFTEFGTPPCAESNPDAFFCDEPIDGLILNRAVYSFEKEAKIICSTCPYQERCLKYALDHPEEQGIWGMSTEKQRRKIRRGEFVHLGIPARRHV